MATVTIGVDIGQKRDPTAVAVAQLEYRESEGRREDHWLIRFLERLPLGTPYPQVADRLSEIVENVRQQDPREVYETDALGQRWKRNERVEVSEVYADATGVGQPVVDELIARSLPVTACYFTHGDRRTVEGSRVTIGKAWLVSRLQALSQSKRIHLPHTTEAEAMEQELLDYEIKVDQNANDRYGAFRVGSHDDLVTALGLAVQEEPWQPLIGRA